MRTEKIMKLKVISVVIGAFITVIKTLSLGLEDLEIRGRVEIILTSAFSRSARIPGRVLDT